MSAAEGGSHGLDIRESPLVEMAAEAERPTRWWVGWIVMFGFGVIGINIIVSPLYTALAGSPAEGSPLFQVGEVFTNGQPSSWRCGCGSRSADRSAPSASGPPSRGSAGLPPGSKLRCRRWRSSAGPVRRRPLDPHHLRHRRHRFWRRCAHLRRAGHQRGGGHLGYLLPIGGLQLSSWLAVFVTSFLFAAAHMNFQPLVLLNITLYAVAASFVALGQGSLWLVCGFHIAWNWAQGNLFGIPVSGTARQVSVWTFGPASGSNDTLTGGDFGIEGSLAATVVLALVSVGSFVYYRRCAARRASTATPVAG
jgi:hypothetical protein